MTEFYYARQSAPKGKDKVITVYPDYRWPNLDPNLLIRGGEFYAYFDSDTGLWNQDLAIVTSKIDGALAAKKEELEAKGHPVVVRWVSAYSTRQAQNILQYFRSLPDTDVSLDRNIVFQNQEPRRDHYVTRKMSYSLDPDGSTEAFDTLFKTLYNPGELEKVMWGMGAALSGSGMDIQKFFVLFGKPGSGKSTLLSLIDLLMDGRASTISVQSMLSPYESFPLSWLSRDPLVGLDHEGDLSRIRTNTILNSVVSHDKVLVNVKYQQPFTIKPATILFIATNKPVQVTDASSGLIRRMLDIRPSGRKVDLESYHALVEQLWFERGAIAHVCIEVFRKLGPGFYDSYIPTDMIRRTNPLYNFVMDYREDFKLKGYIRLKEAWTMYQAWCEDAGINYPLQKLEFRDEFGDYWEEYAEQKRIEGDRLRYVFVGYKDNVFAVETLRVEYGRFGWLQLKEAEQSLFDETFSDRPAQLSNEYGTPSISWDRVDTTLSNIDPTKEHYVLPPGNLVTIDFDIRNDNGDKDLLLNLEAARGWPPTYAETSKSGEGLHLHYYYDGDVSLLSRSFSPGIEVIAPVGKTAIRRRLYLSNDRDISSLAVGSLPEKEERSNKGEHMLSNERSLRHLLHRIMLKEIHPATKPSVDFIKVVLDRAVEQDLSFDITDMKPAIRAFAAGSTNNSAYCLSLVRQMTFKHESEEDPNAYPTEYDDTDDETLVFFDVEVFKNLFVVCFQRDDSDEVVTMINPSPSDITKLLNMRLVGFNNRGYDNHMLLARIAGESELELFARSKQIIENTGMGTIPKAYGISYGDIHNWSTKKQSLKKWEVELGLEYDELELSWEEPVPQDQWGRVAEYCANDVRATKALHHARIADYHARLIMAKLSGLRPNDPTWRHVAVILFGDNRNPQSEFNIQDLSVEFPGYTFDRFKPTAEKSKYKNRYVGEGGYVFARPGMYEDVAYLDVASMHPASLVKMQFFGPYTDKFEQLLKARIAIKEKDFDTARQMFDGRLSEFLDDETEAEDLAYALKIALNSVYGWTASRYDRPFRDERNEQNVIAKRGALFMIDLQEALEEKGWNPVHFKTDSVKIANYTQEMIDFVVEFGKRYGYDFGIENIFSKMVLINDAELAAKTTDGKWEIVGARFAHPYVFKRLFSLEQVELEDFLEERTVQKGAIYIRFPEDDLFIGRVGKFLCVKDYGGDLIRKFPDGRESAVQRSKGFKWVSERMVRLNPDRYKPNLAYYDNLLDEAFQKIAEFGDPTIFCS